MNPADPPAGDRWRMDMHVHSRCSADAITDPRTLVRSWQRTGILPLVCDHDTVAGSRAVYGMIRAIDPDIPRILAAEITSARGEIIGAFLTGDIPAGLSPAETVDCIHDQGGLAIVPHPFCSFRSSALDHEALDEICHRIDAVEGHNGRIALECDNRQARDYGTRHGLGITVGSDAHTPFELGRTMVEMSPFDGPRAFIRALRSGTVRCRPAPPGVRYLSRTVRRVRTLPVTRRVPANR